MRGVLADPGRGTRSVRVLLDLNPLLILARGRLAAS
jgi:hypothetical protein